MKRMMHHLHNEGEPSLVPDWSHDQSHSWSTESSRSKKSSWRSKRYPAAIQLYPNSPASRAIKSKSMIVAALPLCTRRAPCSLATPAACLRRRTTTTPASNSDAIQRFWAPQAIWTGIPHSNRCPSRSNRLQESMGHLRLSKISLKRLKVSKLKRGPWRRRPSTTLPLRRSSFQTNRTLSAQLRSKALSALPSSE